MVWWKNAAQQYVECSKGNVGRRLIHWYFISQSFPSTTCSSMIYQKVVLSTMLALEINQCFPHSIFVIYGINGDISNLCHR